MNEPASSLKGMWLIRACAAGRALVRYGMRTTSDFEEQRRVSNADYTVVDRSPVCLKEGEIVELGMEDKVWEGWVWASNTEDRGTYVPVSSLERLGDGRARVTAEFQAVDLSLKKGEEVIALRETCGWFWCRNAEGTEGWVPDYVLA